MSGQHSLLSSTVCLITRIENIKQENQTHKHLPSISCSQLFSLVQQQSTDGLRMEVIQKISVYFYKLNIFLPSFFSNKFFSFMYFKKYKKLNYSLSNTYFSLIIHLPLVFTFLTFLPCEVDLKIARN